MNLFELLGLSINKNKHKNNDEQKPVQPKKKLDKKALTFTILKTLLISLITVGFVIGGVLAGAALGYISTSDPVTDDQLNLVTEPTIIYDINGNVITELKSTDNKNIIPVKINEVPAYLKDAIIAIEDKRFYEHSGVDLKRTSGAILTLFVGGGKFGGSTITQQLIKNVTGDDSNSVPRKVREIWRAIQLDNRLDKDEILEYYMNIIFMGYDCYGVQSASLAYFEKDVKDLSLAECALLAGITNNPSRYNPLTTNGQKNSIKRQQVILSEMLDQERITRAEYDSAMAEELVFNKNYSYQTRNIQNYFVEYVIITVRAELMQKFGYTRGEANNIIYGGGAKIYTTMNPVVQDALNSVYSDINNFPYNRDNPDLDREFWVQSSMVVLDPQNGYICGLYGASGEKNISFGLNRATQINRQPGSTIKPILVYGPLLDNGTITLSSVRSDDPMYLDSNNPNRIYPTNYDSSVFKGPMTVTTAIAESNNVMPVLLFRDNMKYCLSSLAKVGIDRTSEEMLSTALGGFNKGVNPLELAAAYVPYANTGFYCQPSCYLMVMDNRGTILLGSDSQTGNQNSQLVCQNENTPFLLTSAMKSVVTASNGTAYGKIKIKDNKGGTVEVAGKTGTTNDYRDSWFVGYTPSFVGATWYGFDDNEILPTADRNQSTVIWNKVMQEIHKQLAPVSFHSANTQKISELKICKYSGLLATEACAHDVRGTATINNTVTEYFSKTSANIPTKTCDCHIAVKLCTESNGLANTGCPTTHTKSILTNRPFSFLKVNPTTPDPADIAYVTAMPSACTVHQATNPNPGETTPPGPSQGQESPPASHTDDTDPSPSPSEPDDDDPTED